MSFRSSVNPPLPPIANKCLRRADEAYARQK
uniref:Uncharacterized protein n=1 Tax=Anguilla anguilla TaxID=7936 RepID=A0A0E9QTT5_ANGAN